MGIPSRLKIPKLDLDAAIEHVGLTPTGAMEVPLDPHQAAWLTQSAKPGEKGVAVMNGHYGWRNSTPALFDNLSALQVGDMLYVTDDSGAVISFIIREIRSYGREEDAASVFGSDDGKAHLNLITCEGTWDEVLDTYSKRLVIFSDKI